jgi:hypothetical protein
VIKLNQLKLTGLVNLLTFDLALEVKYGAKKEDMHERGINYLDEGTQTDLVVIPHFLS